MSGVALEPRAVLELLATKVERYLTSGQPEDVLRIEMAEAVTEAWMVLRPNEPAPWRFDVPEVPPSVTALKDSDGDIWLRLARNKWSAVSWPGDSRSFADLIDYAPLVECEDPRTAS